MTADEGGAAAIERRTSSRGKLAQDLGRAVTGALLFGIPLLYTQEMWDFGATLHPWRIATLLVATFALLLGLARVSGFRSSPDRTLGEAAIDAGTAFAVGLVVATVVLWLVGAFEHGYAPLRAFSTIALETVATSIGAMFARSQVAGGSEDHDDETRGTVTSYPGELFLMIVGAVVLAANIAPTEEVVRIALEIGGVAATALALVTAAVMHVFVYVLGFPGSHEYEHSFARDLLRFTVVGYLLVLATCAFLLWIFGRFEGAGPAAALSQIVVLGFPGALGAATVRLVV